MTVSGLSDSRRAISSRGLFTGSGVVGAGCKAIPVDQRLKLSGMRRTAAGAIIALRCREASSQWEEIWQRPRSQTATA